MVLPSVTLWVSALRDFRRFAGSTFSFLRGIEVTHHEADPGREQQ